MSFLLIGCFPANRHDLSQDEEDEISDEKQSIALSKNFEFTDNLAVMNVLRMFVFYQIIAVILDSPR